jgi:hypothetical protein
MSGITETQLRLLTLHGGLQVVEWFTVEAQHAVAGPAPMGDPQLREHLVRLQQVLHRAQGFCLNNAFPKGQP